MKSLAASVSLLALLAAGPSLAQSPAPPTASPPGAAPDAATRVQMNEQDRAFLRQADSAGIAEVEMGRLAMRKAADPAVREFGRWMETDHTAVDDALSRLAARLDVSLTKAPDKEDQAAMQRLEGLNGPAFDQQYVQLQVRDHHKVVALFEREAKEGEQPVVKAVAEHTLTMLRQHLAEADELAKLPGIAAGRSTSGTGSSTPPGHAAPNR